VIAAAIGLTLLPEFSRVINDYKLLLYGGLIVLTMRFAPAGLAGLIERAWLLRRKVHARCKPS
jgi:branched-chain amino acid transport system permease protein